MVLKTCEDLCAVVEAIEGSSWPESTGDAVLLLGVDALEGIGNEVVANLNTCASILLRRAVREDDVEPTLANLGVATKLLDEGGVLLSGVEDDLDQFG